LRAIIFLEQDLSNYKRESDADVKERILLVLNVVYDKHIPAQVARDLHRSRTWASDWLEIQRRRIRRIKKQTKKW
jgi:transposase